MTVADVRGAGEQGGECKAAAAVPPRMPARLHHAGPAEPAWCPGCRRPHVTGALSFVLPTPRPPVCLSSRPRRPHGAVWRHRVWLRYQARTGGQDAAGHCGGAVRARRAQAAPSRRARVPSARGSAVPCMRGRGWPGPAPAPAPGATRIPRPVRHPTPCRGQVDTVVRIVAAAAHTGEIGDGKVIRVSGWLLRGLRALGLVDTSARRAWRAGAVLRPGASAAVATGPRAPGPCLPPHHRHNQR